MKANLTKTYINKINTQSNEFTIWDKHLPCFGLRVWPSGRKVFIFNYRNKKRKRRKITLGEFGILSPSVARKRAEKLKGQVLEGLDPAEERKPGLRFSDLVKNYIEQHAIKKKSGAEDIRILKKDFLPSWGNIPIEDITRRDIISKLEKIAERGPIMSNRSLAVIRKTFNFGIERGFLEIGNNPCVFIKTLGIEKRRDRVLNDNEIKIVWNLLDDLPGIESLTVIALKMILTSALRPGEVCDLEWNEVDIEEGLFEIPASKSKNSTAHRTAISPMTRKLIELIPKVSNKYLFPGHRGSDFNDSKSLLVSSLSKAIRRNRKIFTKRNINPFTPHDLRRTAASIMARVGIQRFVIKRVLNHKDRDITGIYDRYGYDREKKAALNALSEHLEYVLTGKSKIVLGITV